MEYQCVHMCSSGPGTGASGLGPVATKAKRAAAEGGSGASSSTGVAAPKAKPCALGSKSTSALGKRSAASHAEAPPPLARLLAVDPILQSAKIGYESKLHSVQLSRGDCWSGCCNLCWPDLCHP
eukprot:4224925-Amphidinium_carterae.1